MAAPALSRFGSASHLARRFVGMVVDRAEPPEADTAWACGWLQPGELALWARMSAPDRRHAIGVARRAMGALEAAGDAPAGPHARAIAAAALLHDVGKVEADLGPVGRAVATIAGIAATRRAAAGSGRIAAYLRHDQRGAALLEAAGSEPLTIAWAREHHLPEGRWSVPQAIGRALKAADDD